ncbi:hypothetical protein AB0M34_25785, partial [Nocardia sp. NPDC050193]
TDSSDTMIPSAEASRLSLSDHRPAHKISDSPFQTVPPGVVYSGFGDEGQWLPAVVPGPHFRFAELGGL